MKALRVTRKQMRAREQFRDTFVAFLKDAGARKTIDGCYDYRLETPAGPLHLSISIDLPYGPTVFTRFTNVQAGHVATRGASDPYSGKWNFHLHDDATAEDVVSALLRLRLPVDQKAIRINKQSHITQVQVPP